MTEKSYMNQLTRYYDNGLSHCFSGELNAYSDGTSTTVFSLNSMEDASCVWKGSLQDLIDVILKKESE